MDRIPSSPRLAAALLALALGACGGVDVHVKPDARFTRDSTLSVAADADETGTAARLESRLIARGFNVVAALPAADAGAARRAASGRAGAQTVSLPSRLRRVANALPADAPTEDGFAARYTLAVDHDYERGRRFGMPHLEYTRFSARVVDRVTGQIVLSAFVDGGRGVDDTLDELVERVDRSID